MAMRKCPECHKEISTQAQACPYCGYKLNNVKEDKAPYYQGLAASISGAILMCVALLTIFMKQGTWYDYMHTYDFFDYPYLSSFEIAIWVIFFAGLAISVLGDIRIMVYSKNKKHK